MLNNPAQESSDTVRLKAGARFPLRYQVLLPMLATLVVTLVVISALTAAMAARSAASRVDADVARIAKTLRTTTFPLTQPVLDNIAGLSGAELLLTNAKHQVVASTTQVARSGWVPAARSVDEAQGELDRIELAGEHYFHRVVELTRPSRQEEGVDLHVLYPEQAWRQARREAVYPPLLIGAIGAMITLVIMVMLPTGIVSAALLLLSSEMPEKFEWVPKWLLVFPLSLPILGLIYLIWGARGSCRICGQKLFVPRMCLKNTKAHHIRGLGHIVPLCFHILLFKWFRCTYCGTPVRLKK